MDQETLKQYANAYADVEHKREFLKSQKQELINKIIPAEIQTELEGLNEEFVEKEKALDEEEKSRRKILDAAIKDFLSSFALVEKTQIKTDLVTISMDRGDIVWDSAFLDGFAITHPEILSARTEKEPKVRITKNKM